MNKTLKVFLINLIIVEEFLFILYGLSFIGPRTNIEGLLKVFGYYVVLHFAFLIAGRFIERTINIGEEKLLKKRKRRE